MNYDYADEPDCEDAREGSVMALLRMSPHINVPPRSVDAAMISYADARCNWIRRMVEFSLEEIRVCQAQGRPIGARKAGSLVEKYLADWRHWNRARWNARRRLQP